MKLKALSITFAQDEATKFWTANIHPLKTFGSTTVLDKAIFVSPLREAPDEALELAMNHLNRPVSTIPSPIA